MARTARLIIYDSDNENKLARQIALNLSNGIHDYGDIKITIIDLTVNSCLNGTIQELTQDSDNYLDVNE